jgi:riboflavin synthase
MVIATDLGQLALGESIAVSGACLTVVERDGASFAADVSLETVEKTTLGRIPAGARLNLERSLRLDDRLGGHLVSGHVDGIAVVSNIGEVGEARRVTIAAPEELGRFIAAKGSVTLDGVSLTVNSVEGSTFEVMLIPHTRQVTSLGEISEGSVLNIEVDLLARYVVRYLEGLRDEPTDESRDGKLRDLLTRAGFYPGRSDGA